MLFGKEGTSPHLQNPRASDSPPSAPLCHNATQRNCHPSIARTTSTRLSLRQFKIPAAMSQQLSSALLRTCARQQLPTVTRSAAIAAGQQQRGVANASAKFESPFSSGEDATSTLKIPNFKKYTSKSSPTTNKVFSYFVAGTMGLGSAVGAKATVQGALIHSAKELSIAKQWTSSYCECVSVTTY